MDTTSVSRVTDSETIRAKFSDMGKRVFDIIASLAALIILTPVFALIALAIKKDTPGPIFYWGTRVGRGGKHFKILKFRTMYENDQSYQGLRVTAQDDPRITPVGHWLRNTKLNELPQFWNVLKGDMSLVGPRPEDPTFAKSWPLDMWNEVLSVRPGITSPTSVRYRNEEKLLTTGDAKQKYIQELAPVKLRMDLFYVRHHGFWLDLDTLFWTALLLLPMIGAYNPPESMLFVGPATRLARRYLNWFSIDALVTLAALGFSGILWRLAGPLNLGWPRSIALGIGLCLLYSLSGAALGVNRIAWSKANFSDAFELVPAWLIATAAAFIINISAKLLPAEMIVLASLLALGGYIFTRYRSRLLTVIFAWITRALPDVQNRGERVMIIGSGTAAQHAAWLLTHPDNINKFSVVGFVDNDIFKQGTRIYGSAVLGTCKEIPELIEKHSINLVILADEQPANEDFRAVSRACRQAAINYLVLPNLLGAFAKITEQQLSIPVTSTGTGPKVHCEGANCDGQAEDDDNPCLHCLAQYLSPQAVMGASKSK